MEPLFALLTPEDLRQAEVLGKALRFAAMFAAGDPEKAGWLSFEPAAPAAQTAPDAAEAALAASGAAALPAALAAADPPRKKRRAAAKSKPAEAIAPAQTTAGAAPSTDRLVLTLTRRGAILFGEVADARFRSLATAIGADPVLDLPEA